MRTTFHFAGVNQHMSLLYATTGFLVRQATQPPVVGALRRSRARQIAQLHVQRFTNMVDIDVTMVPQQLGHLEQGFWRFFVPQMTDHQGPQMPRGLGDGLPSRAGLKNHSGFGPKRQRQSVGATFLQHNQLVCQNQGRLGAGVHLDVTIKISPRQDDGQPAKPRLMGIGPCSNRFGRAAGMQGQQEIKLRACPLLVDGDIKITAQKPAPAPGGLPIAIVGVGQGGRNN